MYSDRTTAAVSASSHPTSVNGGRAKSRSAEPSRMNSGLTAIRSCGRRSRPAPARRAGTNTRSVVPGSTVLRTRRVYGSARSASPRPMSWPTRWRASTWSWPLAQPGVPTQMRPIVAFRRASGVEIVARKRRARTASATSASSPGSTTGDAPLLTMATFSSSMSTPVTSWPALARQAAVTDPT